MSERTDAIYMLSHVADAFRGQRDTAVIETEEAVLIVKDAEAENERLRNGQALATEAADAAAEAVGAIAMKASATLAENERLRAIVERAIRQVEQEQFQGNGTDALTELYRILCDESIAREPEAT